MAHKPGLPQMYVREVFNRILAVIKKIHVQLVHSANVAGLGGCTLFCVSTFYLQNE